MRNLIDFLIKHHAWIFFILYVVLSCILLFSSNPYQRSVFFGSSNRVVAKVYEVADGVSGYFGLRKANEELLMQNGELAMENMQLRRQLQRYSYAAATDSIAMSDAMLQQYDFVLARVINNSVSHLENYITLDKGSADGITPEMAVVDHRGIVGIASILTFLCLITITMRPIPIICAQPTSPSSAASARQGPTFPSSCSPRPTCALRTILGRNAAISSRRPMRMR